MVLLTVCMLYVIASVFVGSASPSSTTTTTSTTSTFPASTRLGPNGVESTAILKENRRRGTSSWRIRPNNAPFVIQGFANLTYAEIGQNVDLYVTSRRPRYRVVVYRMGWYQGHGAREVWSSPLQKGTTQPACGLDTSTNMVSCANWKVSLIMPITSAFIPGDYLVKLIVGPRAASYIPLTIWDPQSTAAYVIMNRSFTEEGWNTYGGYSFYSGVGPCILDTLSYPRCDRARVVSFDRPYETGNGASDFLSNEYPLVQLCEREGLDVTYISDVTLDEHPNLLRHHRVLLSLDHDEAWSYSERIAVQNAVAHGVNVVYFGAASMVRHVRMQASPLGPDREVVDYRDAQEDPLNGVGNPLEVTGNTWESPPASWSPLAQVGEEYSGYLAPGVFEPMVITDASSWVFRGTGLVDGSSLPGVIASDFDHVIASSATPSDLEILAHSPIPSSSATISGGIWDGKSYSDMVYFTDPHSKAGVLDTGNNVWIGDLQGCAPLTQSCAAPILVKITRNILQVFGEGPSGIRLPAVSNALNGHLAFLR